MIAKSGAVSAGVSSNQEEEKEDQKRDGTARDAHGEWPRRKSSLSILGRVLAGKRLGIVREETVSCLIPTMFREARLHLQRMYMNKIALRKHLTLSSISPPNGNNLEDLEYWLPTWEKNG